MSWQVLVLVRLGVCKVAAGVHEIAGRAYFAGILNWSVDYEA